MHVLAQLAHKLTNVMLVIPATEMKVTESKVHACNVMVHNPIYDGDVPLYESVHNQQYQSRDTVTQYDNIQSTAASITLSDNFIPESNCYVDQKCIPSVTVHCKKYDVKITCDS